MLRVLSANLNGIRSAVKKGFFEWIAKEQFDVLCLQEVRASMESLKNADCYPEGYHYYFVEAEKKGYSGVAIYSKIQPDKIHNKLGWDIADKEGRYIQADFGNLSIISVYLPSGTSGEERQGIKDDFLKKYEKVLKKQMKNSQNYIICGDFNIAHKEIDLKNWRNNQKNSGFLPHERAWLGKLFDDIGYVDAFRVINLDEGQYTWWSQRSASAYVNNVGWRIDYQIISPELKSKVISVNIYKQQKFSDHAPLVIEYDI